MPNYQNGKIYKLYSPSKNLVYYGSTVQTLSQRLTDHLKGYRAYTKDSNKSYVSSFLILDCEDYKIELIEDYPCNNNQQLCKKEGEYIRNNECVNKEIAGRTQQEWIKENIDKVKEYHKKYNKEYQKVNDDKIKEYYENNKEEIKQKSLKYYNDNRDKIKEYKRLWYLKQKELKDKLKDKL
jgi:hypothetical protein